MRKSVRARMGQPMSDVLLNIGHFMEFDAQLPPHYSGITRLFPLPNLVLFPGVVQQLHAFEPRYRQMVKHALAGDRLIGMATSVSPALGFGSSKRQPEAMFRTVCLAKLLDCQEAPDGTFFLNILGLRRAWVRREIPTENLFRMADLRLLDDQPILEESSLDIQDSQSLDDLGNKSRIQRALEIEFWKRELAKILFKILPPILQNRGQIEQLMNPDLSLYLLTDIISYMLNLPTQFKLKQLELVDQVARAQRLVSLFDRSQRKLVTSSSETSDSVGIEPEPSGSSGNELMWAIGSPQANSTVGDLSGVELTDSDDAGVDDAGVDDAGVDDDADAPRSIEVDFQFVSHEIQVKSKGTQVLDESMILDDKVVEYPNLPTGKSPAMFSIELSEIKKETVAGPTGSENENGDQTQGSQVKPSDGNLSQASSEQAPTADSDSSPISNESGDALDDPGDQDGVKDADSDSL